MSCYRIISKSEIDKAKEQGFLEPYEKNQSNDEYNLCVFYKIDDSIIKRHAGTISEKRNLKKGDALYLVEIENFDNKLESDITPFAGWEESRVIFEHVNNEFIKIIAKIWLVKEPVMPECIEIECLKNKVELEYYHEI